MESFLNCVFVIELQKALTHNGIISEVIWAIEIVKAMRDVMVLLFLFLLISFIVACEHEGKSYKDKEEWVSSLGFPKRQKVK